VTLAVAPLPTGAGGHYEPGALTLTIAEALLDEDPRVVAVGLVHELRHAQDFEIMAALGLGRLDCAELEVRAFEAQALVSRAFWPDELPGGTDWEKGVAMAVRAYEAGGTDGIRAMVESVPEYESERCG
jgi:hypothetical protein